MRIATGEDCDTAPDDGKNKAVQEARQARRRSAGQVRERQAPETNSKKGSNKKMVVTHLT